MLTKPFQFPNARENPFVVLTFGHKLRLVLRTFARNFSNIDFFLKILLLKDDELAMSEM